MGPRACGTRGRVTNPPLHFGGPALGRHGASLYDDDLDPEGPSAADLNATPCRGCRTFVDADLDRCPKCGDWLVGDPPQRSSPLWITVVAVGLTLLILLGWIAM